MGKEADKFVKDFKATQKRLKELSFAEGEKKRKALLANLEKTWAAEDVMKEGVVKAKTAGVEGKRSADFIKHKDVSKPFKVWQMALKVHTDGVDEFNKFHTEAKALETALTKRIALVEKELKKSGGMSDMKVASVVQQAKRALPDLKKAAGLFGKLQGHVVMYGANAQRATDAIVRQAVESVTPKEFPPSLAKEGRKKTVKLLKDAGKKVGAFHKIGMQAVEEGDLKRAEQAMKKIEPLMKPLEGLEKDIKVTTGKMKKELKMAPDAKEIQALIKSATKLIARLEEDVEELEEKIDEAQER